MTVETHNSILSVVRIDGTEPRFVLRLGKVKHLIAPNLRHVIDEIVALHEGGAWAEYPVPYGHGAIPADFEPIYYKEI